MSDLITAHAELQKRFVELEAQNKRYREALENIACGNTPWIDGYSETPGEIYEKYAKQTLDDKGDV